jgi:hypothetical protein
VGGVKEEANESTNRLRLKVLDVLEAIEKGR